MGRGCDNQAQQVAEAGGTAVLAGPRHEARRGPGRARPALQTPCARAGAHACCVSMLRAVHQGWPVLLGQASSVPRCSVICTSPSQTRLEPGSASGALRFGPASPCRLRARSLAATTWPDAAGSGRVAIGCHANVQTCAAAVAAQFCGLELWAPRQRAWRAPLLHGPLTLSPSPGLLGPAQGLLLRRRGGEKSTVRPSGAERCPLPEGAGPHPASQPRLPARGSSALGSGCGGHARTPGQGTAPGGVQGRSLCPGELALSGSSVQGPRGGWRMGAGPGGGA